MARWKLCASKTFEILPLSTCTLCQQKSYISKGIQPIFEIFAWARRCWGWSFGWKASGAQVFYFCNGKVKTLRIDKIWNSVTFILYTVPAKFPHLQRFSTDFRKLRLSSKMLRVGIWVGSFRCAGILLLQWQGENFAHRQNLKFCHFHRVHCASKIPTPPKVFNRFSKTSPELDDDEGGHLGVKFQVCRYYTFAMPTWKLWTSTTFEILPISTCTLCQQKSYISKDIQSISELFSSYRRCSTWAFGWKVSGAQVFYFCNRQGENFAHRKHWKFCHFQLVHCASKNPISPKVFNRFSKSLPELEDVEGGHLGGKLQVRMYFTFAMARWKLCASKTFENLPLSTCTLCQQKSYISKDVQPILEIFAWARRCWGWAFGWKASGAQVFSFCNGKVKTLRIDKILNSVTFILYTVPEKFPRLQRYSTDFRKLRLSSKMMRVGIWV